MSAEREVSEENRRFNSNWQEKYFFANNNGKPQCLVRLQLISVPKGKSFFLKNHYSTKREKPYGTYHGNSREAMLKQLKGKQARNQGDNRAIAPA